MKILHVAEDDEGDYAAHLQDPPERLQVAPLALYDGAEDMAPDNLRRQQISQEIWLLEDMIGLCCAAHFHLSTAQVDGLRYNHALVTGGKDSERSRVCWNEASAGERSNGYDRKAAALI